LIVQWLCMPVIPFLCYIIFIQCRSQSRIYAGHPLSMKSLMRIFFTYHVLHNVFLCLITVVAVSYGYMTTGYNWDWELWHVWLLWLMAVLSTTSFVSYYKNKGVHLSFPTSDILALLIPGIGNDVHLAKDWLFIGFCLQEWLCPDQSWKAFVAGSLGILSLSLVFLPLTLSFTFSNRVMQLQLTLNLIGPPVWLRRQALWKIGIGKIGTRKS